MAGWTKDDIKDAMRGRAREFLVNVGGFDPAILDDTREHPCPWCGGRTRFRLIDDVAGAVYCSNCFNRDNGDALAAIMRNQGWDFPTALNECARYLGFEVMAPPAAKSQERPPIPAEEPKTAAEQIPLAGPAILHRAYLAILRTLQLSPTHREHLKARGLPDSAINQSQYRSLVKGSAEEGAAVSAACQAVGDEIRGVPGIREGRLLTYSGLLIPVRNTAGQIVALRVRFDPPAEDGRKYGYVSSKKVGACSGTPCHIPLAVGRGPHAIVRVTEGELKAEVATLLSGVPTIASAGVNVWRTLIEPLKSLQAKTVLLAFDADAITNDKVAKQLLDAHAGLTAAGFDVQLETWDQGDGKGIDDLLHGGNRPEVLAGYWAIERLQVLANVARGQQPEKKEPATKTKEPEQRPKPADVELDGWPDVTACEGQTDVANGLRMRLRFGDQFRWCDPWQKFLVWDRRRWSHDKSLAVDAYARNIYESLWRDFWKRQAGLSNEDIKRGITFIRASGSARGIRGMIDRVRSEAGIPILPDLLDQYPHYLNLNNGTLDLRTMQLHNHDRDDWLTQLCPVTYSADAKCPTWEAFVSSVFAADADLIEFIQRAVGLCLCGDVSEHALFFCYGRGSNGKSTFLNTLMKLLGPDYSCKASSELLLLTNGNSHPTGMTDLCGKRFVACIEADEGKRLAESMVKEMTGADAIRARRMREDFWEFNPTHKIWLAANHQPQIRGTDDGIWRRIKLIPFTVTFDSASKDKNMPEKLAAELPGILNWAIEGYKKWRVDGLKDPDVITKAVAKYRNDMDLLGNFIDEMCIVSSGVKVRAKQLFDAFRDWSESGITMTKFGTAIEERGFAKTKSNGIWYVGIALSDTDHGSESGFQ